MSNKTNEFFENYKISSEKMKEQMPDTIKGFSALYSRVMKNGSVTVAEKEMIAISIGVVLKCEPCIRLHVKTGLDAGLSPEQILEAASVAVVMGGGPALTYLPIVIETLESLEK